MAAEDLLAAVCPDQIGGPEILDGPRELPDHPAGDELSVDEHDGRREDSHRDLRW